MVGDDTKLPRYIEHIIDSGAAALDSASVIRRNQSTFGNIEIVGVHRRAHVVNLHNQILYCTACSNPAEKALFRNWVWLSVVPQPKILYGIGVSVKGAGVGMFLGSNGLPTDVLQVNIMQQFGVNIGCSVVYRIPKPCQLLCVGNLVGGLFCAFSLRLFVCCFCRNSLQSCNFFGIFSVAILYVRQCIDLLLS